MATPARQGATGQRRPPAVERPGARMRAPGKPMVRPPQAARRSRWSDVEPAIAAGVLIFYLGGTWDVAWHIEAGRESFWSPPHLVLYAGVLVILAACARAFVRAWRRSHRLPAPGTVVAALGAGLALSAAPLDELWHHLYGLDVTILSPPHVLLIAGMAITAYGAMAGFALRANRRDPARLAALWRSTSGGWRDRGSEAGLFVSAGIALAVALAAAAEYDFDVSRYAVVYHPVLLAGPGALVLAAAARAGGRVGGATLAAAAYVAVRLLAALELAALTGPSAQIPLVLLAAPALDVALWQATTRLGWRGAPLGGVAFAAALLLVQWPYTTAANRVVWSAPVLAAAALPALLAAAAGALLGWALGAAVRPIVATRPAAAPAARRRAPDVQWDGWTGAGGSAILMALAGLVVVAIAPAFVHASAPYRAAAAAAPDRQSAGWLELSPPVPVVGQPLTARLAFDDPALVGRAPALPYESPRAGDVVSGVVRATAQPGVYQVTFTPREPGRRWLSVFFPGPEEERLAASAVFAVYRPQDAATVAPLAPRPLVLRPEPGPQPDLPDWLQPATYLALALVLLAASAAIGATLRRAWRQQRFESTGALAR